MFDCECPWVHFVICSTWACVAGRGRGDGGFYQRSFDDVEGGFGRGVREMHRSQSWEERHVLDFQLVP